MLEKGDVMKEAKSQYMVEKNFVDVAIQKLIDEDRKYLFIFA
jgi:hypothetical protein